MTPLADLSPAVTAVVALLVLAGAVLTFVGAWGLLRLPTFYERVHAPTMGTTLGTGLILAASIVLFTALQSRPVLQEVAIAVFMTITTPVTFLLLMRATVRREQGRDVDDARHQSAADD